MYKVIALTGAKGSGKDTVANIIKDYCSVNNIDARTVAFADPIKKVIQHIFDLDTTSQEHYDFFKRGVIHYDLPHYMTNLVQGRRVVREIGMLMRSYDEEQFNRYVADTITAHTNSIWIVTDMRFDNEYEMLKTKFRASMIKVKRSNVSYDHHVTEREFADYRVRYLLENHGTETDLRTTTISLFNQIRKEWE